MSSADQRAGRALTVGAFLAGVLFLAGGLIFLCASREDMTRLLTALALLAIGAGLAAWAGIRWRRSQQLSPEVLDRRVTDLAAAHDAELTLAMVMSELDLSDELARTTLARLEANGLCRQERREDRYVYVFPGLEESKVVRRCSYCGNEYSVREPLHKCPNCGGNLEIVKL